MNKQIFFSLAVVLVSLSVKAQGPAEELDVIKYRSTSGVVCASGKTAEEAKESLNNDLNGNAMTPDGKRGVEIDVNDSKHGIVVAPFSTSSPSVTVDSSKKDDDYTKYTICVTVQARAAVQK